MKWLQTITLGMCLCLALAGCKKDSAEAPGTEGEKTEKPEKADKKTSDTPSQAVTEKQNEYIDAYNRLISVDRDLESYLRNNKNIEKSTKLTRYDAPNTGSVQSASESLAKALKISAAVPELDGIAAELAPATTELAATLKTLDTYEDTKEYLSDDGKKARELHPTYVAQAKKVAELHDRFGTAIGALRESQDAARLKRLKAGTIEYEILNAGITARALLAQVDLLDTPTKPSKEDFKAKVEAFTKAATAMLAIYDGPEGQKELKKLTTTTWCDMYKREMTELVGDARELGAAYESGSGVSSKANDYVKQYNDMVQRDNSCNL